jgi:hypothetical protein
MLQTCKIFVEEGMIFELSRAWKGTGTSAEYPALNFCADCFLPRADAQWLIV